MTLQLPRTLSALLLAAAMLPAFGAGTTYQYRSAVAGMRVKARGPAPLATNLVEVSTDSVSFAQTATDESRQLQVVFTNFGPGPLAMRAPVTTGAPFSASTSCAGTLAQGASCVAEVTFSPSQAGVSTGTLVFEYGEPSFSLSVALSGSAVSAETAQASRLLQDGITVNAAWRRARSDYYSGALLVEVFDVRELVAKGYLPGLPASFQYGNVSVNEEAPPLAVMSVGGQAETLSLQTCNEVQRLAGRAPIASQEELPAWPGSANIAQFPWVYGCYMGEGVGFLYKLSDPAVSSEQVRAAQLVNDSERVRRAWQKALADASSSPNSSAPTSLADLVSRRYLGSWPRYFPYAGIDQGDTGSVLYIGGPGETLTLPECNAIEARAGRPPFASIEAIPDYPGQSPSVYPFEYGCYRGEGIGFMRKL